MIPPPSTGSWTTSCKRSGTGRLPPHARRVATSTRCSPRPVARPSQPRAARLPAQRSRPRRTYSPRRVPAEGVDAAVAQVERRQDGRHARQSGVSFDVLGEQSPTWLPPTRRSRIAAHSRSRSTRRAGRTASRAPAWPRDVAWLHGFRAAMTPFVGNGALRQLCGPLAHDWQRRTTGGTIRGCKRSSRPTTPTTPSLFRSPSAAPG